MRIARSLLLLAVVFVLAACSAVEQQAPQASPAPADQAPAAVEPVPTDPVAECVNIVITALELDNAANNRIEAVKISRTYGDGSPPDRAYTDVSTEYYRDAQQYGIDYATTTYSPAVESSCREDDSFRADQIRGDVELYYPEIKGWSNERVLKFREWICPIRNGSGKPTASEALQKRYDVSNSVAYELMDAAC